MSQPKLLRKVCSGCFSIKHPKEFSEEGWLCKECPSTEETVEEAKVPEPEVCPPGTRKCYCCNRFLPDIKFGGRGNKCSNCRKGRYKTCKACGDAGDSSIFRRGQEICRTCEFKGAIVDRECRGCGETKPTSSYRPNSKTCSDCDRSHGRNYRRTTTKAKEWVQSNTARMAELQKDWYEKNKPEIRAKESEKLKTDPQHYQIKLYRSGVQAFIRKGLSFNKKLDIDRETFLEWTAFCNEEDIDFSDRPSWNVDHVLPLDLLKDTTKSVEYASQVKKDGASHCIYLWMNVRPVKALANRKKNRFVQSEAILAHRKRLIEFTKSRPQLRTDDYFTYINACQHILDMFGRV